MNCLNMMRFWHISPVATFTGRDAPRGSLVAGDIVGARRLLDEPGLAKAAAALTQSIA
jgi:hypothetical protein